MGARRSRHQVGSSWHRETSWTSETAPQSGRPPGATGTAVAIATAARHRAPEPGGPCSPRGRSEGGGEERRRRSPPPPARTPGSAVFGHKGTDQTQPCTVATLPPTPLPTGTHRQCCLICFIQNETKRNKNHARSHIGWPGTAPELGACHVQQRGLRLLLLQFPCQSEDTGKGQWGSLAAWGAVCPGQRPGPLCSQPRAKLTQGPDARASAGLGTAGAKETCFHGGSGGLAGAGQRGLRDLPHCRRRP